MALFTFGEGYHNYHHTFQHDYRNGIKAWHWDPTKWTILILQKIGLVSDLRKVPEERILMAEIRETLRRMEEIHSNEQVVASSFSETSLKKLQEARESLNQSLSEIQKAVQDRIQLTRDKIEEYRQLHFQTNLLLSNL